MTSSHDFSHSPHLGGKAAVTLFIIVLLAFVVESQLTQYVQTTLKYRQPYFLFYVVHSSFFIIFPTHLVFLVVTTGSRPRALLSGLLYAISRHLTPSHAPVSATLSLPPKAARKLLLLVLVLTAGITIPGLLWFAAISMASVSDVSAIWNCNAFFAYVITVKLFHLKWEPRRLMAVMIATAGVIAVVYGGSTLSEPDLDPIHSEAEVSLRPSAPLIGDLMTLLAAVVYGSYQVLYKKYAALPSDPEVASDGFYQQIVDSEVGDDPQATSNVLDREDLVYPPPFGFHPNFLTSALGLCTFAVMWIPIPILHLLGIETFVLPLDAATVLAIVGIAMSGVLFNAGFMILLGVWGPIITSVGNLLTIVLVLISDIIFGDAVKTLTIWSLTGAGAIIAAFGVLAFDMFNGR